MSLEFDSRCAFAQREDKIGDLLIPRRNGLTPAASAQQSQSQSKQQNTQPVVAPYVDVNFDDLYTDWDRYALNVPPGVVLLPGQRAYNLSSEDAYVYMYMYCMHAGSLVICLTFFVHFMMFTHAMPYTGNEVHIVVNTDTEYEKKDANNHFGLKCQVVGYEWASNPTDVSTIDHQ